MSLPVCFTVHLSPSKKGCTLKRKNLLSGGAFFSFRVDHFSKERQNQFVLVASPESVSILHKIMLTYTSLPIYI